MVASSEHVHTQVLVKNCSRGRCERQCPVHTRKEDMHSGLLCQLPLQTPLNWLHPIQAALKRVCGSIKEVTLEDQDIYPVLCEEEQQPGGTTFPLLKQSVSDPITFSVRLCCGKLRLVPLHRERQFPFKNIKDTLFFIFKNFLESYCGK